MGKNLELAFLYDFYGKMLTDKQQAAMESYYHFDLSLAEIADNKGITRQGVRDSIKRAEAQLLDMEQKLGYAKQFEIMKKGFEEITNAANNIKDYYKRIGSASEVQQQLDVIYKTTEKLSKL